MCGINIRTTYKSIIRFNLIMYNIYIYAFHNSRRVFFVSMQAPKTNSRLQHYLSEREVIDVLEQFSDIARKINISDLLSQLKALLPRYYSVSSSPIVVSYLFSFGLLFVLQYYNNIMIYNFYMDEFEVL